MVLHYLQEHFGFISDEAVFWTAEKLGLQPINVLELVTFYPMYRQHAVGKRHIRVCRTLSCAMCGSYNVLDNICDKTGIDRSAMDHHHPIGVSKDGEWSIEFVECLASCGTGPVLMVEDHLYENVDPNKIDELLEQAKKDAEENKVTAKKKKPRKKKAEAPQDVKPLKTEQAESTSAQSDPIPPADGGAAVETEKPEAKVETKPAPKPEAKEAPAEEKKGEEPKDQPEENKAADAPAKKPAAKSSKSAASKSKTKAGASKGGAKKIGQTRTKKSGTSKSGSTTKKSGSTTRRKPKKSTEE
jgi:NADH-quinone oxidoreductase subunit E